MSLAADNPDRFPKLPILGSQAPPRTERDKYGGMIYLGIAGLAFLIVLVAWFAYGVWHLRGLWADIFVLNDNKRPDAERIMAALRLSRDPRVTDSQLMEMSLSRNVPDLARYLLAEAVSTDLVAHDPRGYSLTVARSPLWPDWLRLLLARRLAYGKARGYAIPREALDELARHADPMIRLWAECARALPQGNGPQLTAPLEQAARARDANGELAAKLLAALTAPPSDREHRLDEVTLWLRHHHPESAAIWRGWELSGAQLEKKDTG